MVAWLLVSLDIRVGCEAPICFQASNGIACYYMSNNIYMLLDLQKPASYAQISFSTFLQNNIDDHESQQWFIGIIQEFFKTP